MIRLLPAAMTMLLSMGCLNDLDLPWPQAMELTVRINKGGAGSVRMDSLGIRSPKQREEGAKELKEYIEESKKTNWGEESSFAGCTEVSHEIGYDAQGNLNAHVECSAPDILVLLRLLDRSSPFRLRRDCTFSFDWNGDVLSIKYGHQIPKLPEPKPDDCMQVRMTFTTEGEFIRATHGHISADRTKLVVTDAIDTMSGEWGFSIRGLAADR